MTKTLIKEFNNSCTIYFCRVKLVIRIIVNNFIIFSEALKLIFYINLLIELNTKNIICTFY